MTLGLLVSELEYSCGSPVTVPDGPLHGTIFVRIPLTCSDVIEVAYYRSAYGPLDLCCFCGEPEGVVDQDLLKRFKTVLPLCADCRYEGKEVVCALPYGKNQN